MRWNRVAVTLGTWVVLVNAFWLYDSGPAWSQALRWFLAGFCLALLFAGFVRSDIRRRSVEAEQREIERIATAFATEVEREMRDRGFVGEVDIVVPPDDGHTRH